MPELTAKQQAMQERLARRATKAKKRTLSLKLERKASRAFFRKKKMERLKETGGARKRTVAVNVLMQLASKVRVILPAQSVMGSTLAGDEYKYFY